METEAAELIEATRELILAEYPMIAKALNNDGNG